MLSSNHWITWSLWTFVASAELARETLPFYSKGRLLHATSPTVPRPAALVCGFVLNLFNGSSSLHHYQCHTFCAPQDIRVSDPRTRARGLSCDCLSSGASALDSRRRMRTCWIQNQTISSCTMCTVFLPFMFGLKHRCRGLWWNSNSNSEERSRKNMSYWLMIELMFWETFMHARTHKQTHARTLGCKGG